MDPTEREPLPMKRSGSYGLLPPIMSESRPLDDNLHPDTLRIVLIGKTGSGKSSTGNTILGRKEFKAKSSSKSITQSCQKAQSDVDRRCVTVVDTPGLFDTALSDDEVVIETSKCISSLAPGPHAFLLVLQIGRYTKEEIDAVNRIKVVFGESATKYINILFTHGDDLEDDDSSVEEYLNDGNEDLKKLISDCGNRFHVFNNREKDRAQVKELLEKIDLMVKENGGSHYTNEMFQEAEEAIQKEKERIMKEKEEEMRREQEKIDRKYQQKMEKELGDKEEQLRERERQCDKEIKEMKERYEEEARRKAEENNTYLKKVQIAVGSVLGVIVGLFAGPPAGVVVGGAVAGIPWGTK